MRSFEELRNAGVRDVTDLTDGEIKTIAAFVITNEKRIANPKYLEIGVMAGTTIRYLKQYTKTTLFTGVDLFEDFVPSNNNTHISDAFSQADVSLKVGDRSTFIKGDSAVVLPQLAIDLHYQDYFDFIFIDGNHTSEATRIDFQNSVKLLKPGGQIAFHNASPHMGPDFEQYVTRDGGPWLVCQEIKKSSATLLAEIDRLTVFGNLY